MKIRWLTDKKIDTPPELPLPKGNGGSPIRILEQKESLSEQITLPVDFWEIDEAKLQRAPAGMRYEISVEIFFNARHKVVNLGVLGPEHTHSFRLQAKCQGCELNHDGQLVVGYKRLRDNLVQIVRAYNNKMLNDLPPFIHRQPTTENLTGIIFQQLDKVIQSDGLRLSSLTIWDSPTTAITVRRNVNVEDGYYLNDSD